MADKLVPNQRPASIRRRSITPFGASAPSAPHQAAPHAPPHSHTAVQPPDATGMASDHERPNEASGPQT